MSCSSILWRNIVFLSILLALKLSCTPAKLVFSVASFILGAYPQWVLVLCDLVKFLSFGSFKLVHFSKLFQQYWSVKASFVLSVFRVK